MCPGKKADRVDPQCQGFKLFSYLILLSWTCGFQLVVRDTFFSSSSLFHIPASRKGWGLFFPSKGISWKMYFYYFIQFSSVQLLSCVWLFATPWTAAHQASLSITNSGSLPKLMSIELVMPSNHLILCHPLLLPPSIFPSNRVFSNESALCNRWPMYWSFSFSISPSKEHPGLMSFWMDCWISLQFNGLSRVFSNTTVQKHQFFGAKLSSQFNSHIHTWLLEKP